MGIFVLYIFKWAFSLVLLLAVYKVLLSGTTFHRFNRCFLMGILIISAVLPLCKNKTEIGRINIVSNNFENELRAVGMSDTKKNINEIPSKSNPTISQETITIQQYEINWADAIVLLYLLTIFYFLIAWGYSTSKMLHLLYGTCKIRHIHRVKLAVYDGFINPFSWMNYICISNKDIGKEQRICIMHELAHIKNMHYIDLIIVLLCALINPAVWLLLKELKAVHEYEADKYVLEQNINSKEYQLLLIKKSVGAEAYALANSFNNNPIKKRIIMMTKKKTNQWTKIKVLVALPAIAFSIAVFAKSEQAKDMETMFSHIDITEWAQNLITDNFASTKTTSGKGESLQRVSATTQDFNISGAWELVQSMNKENVFDYTTQKNYKRYKILDKTGRYCTAEIMKTKHATGIEPHENNSYEFTTDKKYIENGHDMKLRIVDDNTIIMMWGENEETWKRANLSDDLVKYIEIECNKKNELEDLLKKNNLFD